MVALSNIERVVVIDVYFSFLFMLKIPGSRKVEAMLFAASACIHRLLEK